MENCPVAQAPAWCDAGSTCDFTRIPHVRLVCGGYGFPAHCDTSIRGLLLEWFIFFGWQAKKETLSTKFLSRRYCWCSNTFLWCGLDYRTEKTKPNKKTPWELIFSFLFPSCSFPEESWWPGGGTEGSFWVQQQVFTAQSTPQWQGRSEIRSASPRLPWNVLFPFHLFQQTFHLSSHYHVKETVRTMKYNQAQRWDVC